MSNLDFIRVGNSNDADTSIVLDLDATLVFATGHCENAPGGATKVFELWVNGAYSGTNVGTLGPGANTTFVNNVLDVDLIRGDRVHLRAVDGVAGNINDTEIKLTFKWRG